MVIKHFFKNFKRRYIHLSPELDAAAMALFVNILRVNLRSKEKETAKIEADATVVGENSIILIMLSVTPMLGI